jgi:hypothetical protein
MRLQPLLIIFRGSVLLDKITVLARKEYAVKTGSSLPPEETVPF